MILPERVFGRPGAHWIQSGVAMAPISLRTCATRSLRSASLGSMPPEQAALPNTKLLGIEIYTDYLYPLQLAAVLLLVAIIAAIALTLRERKDSRHLDASQQVRAKKAGRLRLVKMAAEMDAPAAPPAADATPEKR